MGFVHHSAHAVWLMVDSHSQSMDRSLVFGRPSPHTFPFGLAYVHRVQARAADEGSPLFPSPPCSHRWCAHQRDPTAALAFN